MVRRFILSLVILLPLGAGCSDLLLGDDPGSTPEKNFEMLWNEFDRLYGQFVIRGVNWDSLYAVYRPQVTGETSDAALFTILATMLGHLNDGHVYLLSPFRGFVSNEERQSRRAENFNLDNVVQTYLKTTVRTRAGRFVYGTIDTIGYIHITTFEDVDFARVDDWVAGLDKVLKDLEGVRALVVDVRNNGGGDALNANAIAGRFADQRRLFAYGYSRNGNQQDDFTKPYAWHVEPKGRRFQKPVALLTNKNTASAAERFTLAMRVLPNVTIIGDSTEGAFPHAVPRELPNGWSYRITVGVVEGPDHEIYEGLGIPPDVVQQITAADAQQKRDTILERALAVLAGIIQNKNLSGEAYSQTH